MATKTDVELTGSVSLLYRVVVIAAVVDVLTMSFGRTAVASRWLAALLPVARLIPNIKAIAAKTTDPVASELTLLLQWFFAPIYAGIFFVNVPPWSRLRREIARNAYSGKSLGHRHFTFMVGILFSGAWLLGDAGVVPFPTFFNGRFALATGIPQLRLIVESPILFSLYAWAGPMVETVMLWINLVLIFNARVFLAYSLVPGDGS